MVSTFMIMGAPVLLVGVTYYENMHRHLQESESLFDLTLVDIYTAQQLDSNTSNLSIAEFQ
ncbi:MAG: hypothetical protein IPG07_12485 [Crocinitomicaceae bacterium]|nr:hypothetical protein [Crocinitomicaceae bacterium]